MHEVIYKQAAIDAVITEGRDVNSRYLESERIIYEADAIEAISMLPPAEPEIIRCKDCEWWEKQKDSAQGRCDLMQMYPTGGWYCGNAQKRVTNGGLD